MPVRKSWPGEACYDGGNPFGLRHIGKIAVDTHDEDLAAGPRNHCVVSDADDARRRVLRYTPVIAKDMLQSGGVAIPPTTLGNITGSAVSAAALHQRHLDALEEAGLQPWYEQVEAGRSEAFNGSTEGVFVLQSILPEGSEVLSEWNVRPEIITFIQSCLGRYYDWAQGTDEPGHLYDMHKLSQYAVTPEQGLVLVDVEPYYISQRTPPVRPMPLA